MSFSLANVFLMHLLTRLFLDLVRQAAAGDEVAQYTLAFSSLGMWILPAAGAVMKRWHFHRRLQAHSQEARVIRKRAGGMSVQSDLLFLSEPGDCIGNSDRVRSTAFRKGTAEQWGHFHSPGIPRSHLTIVQTFLIYQYFSPPKKPPKSEFLRSPRSEMLGDICLFLNMILFQIGWNTLTFAGLGPPSGIFGICRPAFRAVLYCLADLFSSANVLSGRRHQPSQNLAHDVTR